MMQSFGFPIVDRKIRLNVHIDSLWKAITEERPLRKWFANDCRLTIASAKDYSFWGRYTVGYRDSQPNQKILEMIKGVRFVFSWELKGVTTRVEYDFLSEPLVTEMRVRHSSPVVDAVKTLNLHDSWVIYLMNLKSFVEKSVPIFRFDYSTVYKGDFQLTLPITARPERIYLVLTDPVQLNRWIAKNARVNPIVGGRITFGWEKEKDLSAGPSQILNLFDNKEVAYSWWHKGGETRVIWAIHEEEKGCKLTLVHDGFDPDEDSYGYYQGWTAYMLCLKTLAETDRLW